MRELNKLERPTEKHTGKWMIGLILLGLARIHTNPMFRSSLSNPIRDNLVYRSYKGEVSASSSPRL